MRNKENQMESSSKNKTLRITFYALFLLVFIFGAVTPALAQGGEPTDDEVNKIAKQLFCPVCESTPLDVCPTEACRQWRELIRQMLAEGKSEQEIKDHFVKQYGVRVLNEPPNRWASYLVPAVAFLAGAFLLFRGFRMWIKPIATESVPPIKDEAELVEQDDYIKKFEEELKKRN
jgi:cytochrome c-type biogenesis protein CcmH